MPVRGPTGDENLIVLMSTLAAAADVVHGMSERHLGRDPSSQEDPAIVRPFLHDAARELEDNLLSLLASRVLSDSGEPRPSVALSRRMNELMILRVLARLLQVIHQRLLSLYPSVCDELVEDARLLQVESAALRDGGERSVTSYIQRVYAFRDALRSAV